MEHWHFREEKKRKMISISGVRKKKHFYIDPSHKPRWTQNLHYTSSVATPTFVVHPAERVEPIAVLREDVRVGELAGTLLYFDLPTSIVRPRVFLKLWEVAEVVGTYTKARTQPG